MVMDLRLKELSKLLRATEIPCNVPHFDIDEYEGRVEDIARMVRETWQIPRGPIQDLILIICRYRYNLSLFTVMHSQKVLGREDTETASLRIICTNFSQVY